MDLRIGAGRTEVGFLEDLPPYDSSDPAALGRAVTEKIQGPYRSREEQQKLDAEEEARTGYVQGRARAERAEGFNRGRSEVGLPVAEVPPLVPMSPLQSNVSPPEPPMDYSHFEEEVRNSLAGAPRGFIDKRDPSPLDPNGPRPVPAKPAEQRTRAVLMPGGKILLTNLEGPQDAQGKAAGPSYAAQGGQEVSGQGLYDAVGKRGAGVSSAQAAGLPASGHGPASWRTGTTMDTPPEISLGHVGLGGEALPGALHQNPNAAGGNWGPTRGGAFSQLTPTSDQKIQLALEDARDQEAVYGAQAGVAQARQAAAEAGMSLEERAQATAAGKAPELLGMQAIRQEQTRAARAMQEWDRRASTPGDPAYIEPQNRTVARRAVQDKLEDNIKVLAGIVGRQRQLPEGLAGLGG